MSAADPLTFSVVGRRRQGRMRARSLREGQEFRTAITRRAGVVVEQRDNSVAVLLEPFGEDCVESWRAQTLHPLVLVEGC